MKSSGVNATHVVAATATAQKERKRGIENQRNRRQKRKESSKKKTEELQADIPMTTQALSSVGPQTHGYTEEVVGLLSLSPGM